MKTRGGLQNGIHEIRRVRGGSSKDTRISREDLLQIGKATWTGHYTEESVPIWFWRKLSLGLFHLLSFHNRSSCTVPVEFCWISWHENGFLWKLEGQLLFCIADVVYEEAVGKDDDKETSDEEKPKVTNPDSCLGLGGQKWESFFVHLNSELVPSLLFRFQNTSKSFSVKSVFTWADPVFRS